MTQLSLTIPGTTKGSSINIDPVGGVPSGGTAKIFETIGTAISVLFMFGVILCLFILIISGIQWLISGGEKQKVMQVRQRMIFAVVGLAVIFLSYFIISLVTNFFGFKIAAT